MKALRCRALTDDLTGVILTDVPEPMRKPGELLVRVSAVALNFPDLLMTRGGYQYRPDVPFTLGTEACGVIMAADDPAVVGTRVIVGGREGCAAEYLSFPAHQVRPAPANLSDAEAAGHTVTGLTAWVGLITRGGVKKGDRVLVLGAGSGVSLAAIDIAHSVGASVIAAASSEEKLDPARARGVVATIITPRSGISASDLKAQLKSPIDVVYDPIGAHLTEPALRALAWKGRYLVIGFAGGAIPAIPLNLALLKGVDIIGVRAGEYGRRDPLAHVHHLASIDVLASAGKLRPHIGCQLPLADAKAALQKMAVGTLVGKAVLTL
jgi:NADPH:quinone reductase